MVAGWFATGAALCGLGVLLGAFGAHGLRERLTPDMLAVFETGVRYHLFHGLAVMAVAWAAARWPGPLTGAAGWLFVAGIFSIGDRKIFVLDDDRGVFPIKTERVGDRELQSLRWMEIPLQIPRVLLSVCVPGSGS